MQLADSVTGETKIKSSLDLNGKTVNVVAGSSAIQRMNNLAKEIGGNIEVVENPELSDELLALKVVNGDVTLAVVNEKIAKKIAESFPLLKYDSTISFTQFQVWIFNHSDSTALKKFDNWFETFRNSDSYRNLINKY